MVLGEERKKKIFNFSITIIIIIILLLSLLWSSVEHSVYSVGGYAPTVQQQQQQPEGQTLPPGGIPYDAHCLLKKKNLKKKRGGPVTPSQSTLRLNNHHIRLWHPEKQKKTFVFFWFFFFGLAPTTLLHGGRRESKHGGGLLESWFKRKLSKSTSALYPAYLYALTYLGDGCFKVSFLVLFGDDSTAEIFAILHRVNSNLQRKRQSSWLFPFLFKYHRYISYQGYIYIYVKQFNNTITEIKSRHASQKIQKKGQYTKIIIKQKQKTEKKILSRVSHHH